MWLSGDLQIWLYSKATDMRKSIDSLSTVVSEQLEHNPCSAGDCCKPTFLLSIKAK